MQHTSTQPEEWRYIPGYEGTHQVSDHGHVRSVGRTIVNKLGHEISFRGRTLRLKDDDGYLRVELNAGGVGKMHFVHRLVLAAFVGEVPEGMQCRHLDGNPKNNHFHNLRYGTVSENQLDRVKHGTHQEAVKTHCPRGHHLGDPNLTKNGKKLGKRICLACARAHGYTSYRKELKPHFKKVADSYYEKIMK